MLGAATLQLDDIEAIVRGSTTGVFLYHSGRRFSALGSCFGSGSDEPSSKHSSNKVCFTAGDVSRGHGGRMQARAPIASETIYRLHGQHRTADPSGNHTSTEVWLALE